MQNFTLEQRGTNRRTRGKATKSPRSGKLPEKQKRGAGRERPAGGGRTRTAPPGLREGPCEKGDEVSGRAGSAHAELSPHAHPGGTEAVQTGGKGVKKIRKYRRRQKKKGHRAVEGRKTREGAGR